jgi:thiopeptide-type bacteriocin biosynthesis protein
MQEGRCQMKHKRVFIPGSKWLFYKIYCGETYSNILLQDLWPLIDVFKKGKLISHWFFIRYSDPDFHIRLRFAKVKEVSHSSIMEQLESFLTPLLDDTLIWDVQIGTYHQEIERYGVRNMELCELIFAYQSEHVLTLLSRKLSIEASFLHALYLMIEYIDILFSLKESRLEFCKENYLVFKKEFNLKKEDARKLNNKYNNVKKELETSINDDNQLVEDHIKNIRPLLKILENKEMVAPSILHMLVNRYFEKSQRAMEMLLYHHLEKHYRTSLIKEIHNG